MKVDIHCKGMPLTDAIRDHVYDKLGKLERILPGEIEVLTILKYNSSRQGGSYSAEISFRVWSNDVVAKEENEDMYRAVTSAAEQVISQTRKLKEKRSTRRKGAETVRNYAPITDNTLTPEEEEEEFAEMFDEELPPIDVEPNAEIPAPTETENKA